MRRPAGQAVRLAIFVIPASICCNKQLLLPDNDPEWEAVRVELLLKQCMNKDVKVPRELLIKTYFKTFAVMNTAENMEAYLDQAFNIDKFRAELADADSSFYFLYSGEELAGYLKLNEASAQSDINDRIIGFIGD